MEYPHPAPGSCPEHKKVDEKFPDDHQNIKIVFPAHEPAMSPSPPPTHPISLQLDDRQPNITLDPQTPHFQLATNPRKARPHETEP